MQILIKDERGFLDFVEIHPKTLEVLKRSGETIIEGDREFLKNYYHANMCCEQKKQNETKYLEAKKQVLKSIRENYFGKEVAARMPEDF